jgi:putative tricarboxylic transport membrane protein
MHAAKISGVVFLLLFSAYGLLTRDIQLDFWAAEELFTARTWPMIVAAGGVLLSLLYIFSADRLPRLESGLNWVPLVLLLILMSCYGAVLEPLGFIISTTLFLLIAYMILGERRPVWLILCSFPVVVFFYLLLSSLGIYLEPGPFEALL